MLSKSKVSNYTVRKFHVLIKDGPTTGWGSLGRKDFLQPIIPDILIRLLPEQNLGYQLWTYNEIIPTNSSVFSDPLDSHSVFLFTVPRLLKLLYSGLSTSLGDIFESCTILNPFSLVN